MRRRTLWINLALIAGIVIVGGLILMALRPEPVAAPQRTATVVRADVVATVTASGTVESAGRVEANVETPGTVTRIAAKVGDTVRKGDLIARVDASAARQQVAAAEAGLAQALSAAGSAGTSVGNASAALEQARRAQEAGNTRLDQAVTQAEANLRAAQALWSDACLTPDAGGCPNPSAAAAIRAAENAVTTAQLSYDGAVETAASNAIGYDQAVDQANARLAQARTQESATCTGAVGTDVACTSARGGTLTAQQAYDSALTSRVAGTQRDAQSIKSASMALSNAQVALQRTQADLAKAGTDAVRTATQALTTAKSARESGRLQNAQAVQSAQAALDSARAGTTTQATGTSQLEAAVRSAEAALAAAQRTLAQTRLTAPVAGTVAAVNLTVGESSAAQAPAPNAIIVPSGSIEAVAGFAESDAADISVGDSATVTFEALPGVEVQGSVIAIDPLSTTTATGLVTYEVRVELAEAPEAVREGMTTSVSVIVDEVTATVAVPAGAITTVGDSSTVEVLNADGLTTTTVEVTVGVQGDTLTEVTSGLDEGAVVVIPSADDGVGLTFPQGGVPGEGRAARQGSSG